MEKLQVSKMNSFRELPLAVVESGSQGRSRKRWQSPRDKNYIKSVTERGGKLRQTLFVFDGKDRASASVAVELARLDGGKLSMFNPCKYVDLPLVGHRDGAEIRNDLALCSPGEEYIALDDELRMLLDRYELEG